MCDRHLGIEIRAETLAQLEHRPDPDVGVVAERPDLVRAAGHLGAQGAPWFAVAVEPEQRAEGAVLEPADDQLAELGIVRVATMDPPMSDVHQGIPDRPMLRPARTCRRSESHVAGMSPDQTAAP
jgi:hypothetical protein